MRGNIKPFPPINNVKIIWYIKKVVIISRPTAYILFMDYRQTIKELRHEYRGALADYYGKGHLIFKTIFEDWARGLYQETDLAFRTAGVINLSDKNIDRLIAKGDTAKAIEKLNMRVNGCDYLSILMQYTQAKTEFSNPNQLAVMEKFKQIDHTLKRLSSQDQERIENLTITPKFEQHLNKN